MIILYIVSIRVLSSFLAISSKNPRHAILAVTLIFICGGSLRVFINAQLLGLLVVTIYAGALTILFIFILAAQSIHEEVYTPSKYTNYIAIFLIIGLSYLILTLVALQSEISNLRVSYCYARDKRWVTETYRRGKRSYMFQAEIQLIGQRLYNQYSTVVILLGFLLFTAMLGAIFIIKSVPGK